MICNRYLPNFIFLVAMLTSVSALARGGGGHGGGWGGGHGGGHISGGFGGRSRYSGGYARGHWGGGGNYGRDGHHMNSQSFFFYGSPFFWPSYFYPPYYPQPDVNTPKSPLVYIEQGTMPKVQPLEPNYWDYCANPSGYYPHVKACQDGWQKIEPQPIGQEPGYWYYCSNPAGYYPYVRECPNLWQKIVP